MGIKQDIFCKFGDAAFDIPRGRGFVPRKEVAEIPLLVDKEAFIGEYRQCISDGSVPVRVILHAVADDIGNLMELSVIHLKKRMQNTPLYRLEAVLYVGNCTVTDNITGIL